jgi:hypothetical protein
MEIKYKIVKFNEWCEKCKYFKTKEEDEPCRECLQWAVNQQSHKPINYKEEK